MIKRLAVATDFDGVWADSFTPLLELNQKVFSAIGRTVTAADHREWYLKNVKTAKRELLEDREYFRMQEEFDRLHQQHYQKARLFPWTDQVLPKLNKIARLVIVSSTRDFLIRELLGRHSLIQYFEEILGRPDLGKHNLFCEAVGVLKTEPAGTFFISDTVGDITEGKDFGFKTIAVTWGFHSRELLRQSSPDYIIESPEELFSCLKSAS